MKVKDIKIGVDFITAKTDIKKFLDDYKRLKTERMYVFGFDDNARYVLAENITVKSDNNEAEIDVTKLMNRLKETKSTAFILVHNHPNGVCVPTDKDVKFTKEVRTLALKNKIILMEHYTWTNGLLWGILGISIKNKNFTIKTRGANK